MATKHRILAGSTAALLTAGILVPAAHAQSAPEIEGVAGSVEWNFKDSFMSYVTGSFAGGTVTVSDGATWEKDQPFTFPVNPENSEVTDEDTAVIDLDGEVNFNAHGGILDITVSDLELHIDGTTGALYGDHTSSPMSFEGGEEPLVGDDIKIVDITFDEAVDLTEPLTLTGATILAESGVPVLSNYPAGDAFSDLVLDVEPITEDAEPVEPGEPGDPSEPSSDAKDSSSTSSGSSTDEDGLLAGILNLLNTTLGLGAIGGVIASIAKFFTDLLR